MKRFALTLVCVLGLATGNALAWSNHAYAAYRTFEKMPELANAAPVTVEPLEVFLKAQEKPIESLLASQEAWAQSHLEVYPPRPEALAFKADPTRTDAARRLAFLMALRVAPNSKLALYLQPDPWSPHPDPATLLAHAAVNTLPEQADSTYRFVGLKAGDQVTPLSVIASASNEPDYGMDINLWADSPSDWGKVYGFGALPFGNPALYFSTQAPFHMGFYHEDRIIYMAAPFIKKTFPLLRAHQYSSLAALAFRTGHAYWGWRFTGLALHYVQDLTQPYHASLAPGNSSLKLISINLLALAGLPRMKNEMIVLLSNRHLALEKYQDELLYGAAQVKKESGLERALRNSDKDASYPAWSDLYVRDVVSRQSYALGAKLVDILVDTLPPVYVSDPSFDFGVKESGIHLVAELSQQDPAKRARLDAALAELLGNFGAHSRNVVRGVLKAGVKP
ncbi:MAG: hypothetical protein Q8K21_08230 [Hydrogenophaga sp.]|uniref:hypothetical protein n=1 Tax=Hydrogenophaga sp. TaxID=1904254 RepID=UPI002730C321|nr:hypothetical protein [Hydrogenophaga sp.]MDP2164194.1 hypothetical protein [Hydrogenophaga sp.]